MSINNTEQTAGASPVLASTAEYYTGLGNVLLKIRCTSVDASSLLANLYLPPPPVCYTDTRLLCIGVDGIYLDGQIQPDLGGDLPRGFLSALTQSLAASQTEMLLFHAAALVSPQGRLYLFPGASGCGKTTLSVGLALSGWDILTDELVLLSADYKIGGFLRPVHVRKNSIQLLPFAHAQHDCFIATEEGALLSAAVLPSNGQLFAPNSNGVSILFLRYFPERKDLFCDTALSKAETLARLMGVNINGRNFEGNGFRRVAEWVRRSDIISAALDYHDWSTVADYIGVMERDIH